ncbi:MAG: GNAT family N-acetyltransferase [Proteobacteria bacterium]|nr:GNAT family N-acetyltransferase [Pseudomonadota bacterium]
MKIRNADPDDVAALSDTIGKSYRDVAERFGLTPENCPKHPSNCSDDWIRSDFSRGVSYFILEDEGTPVGCVALEKASRDLCYLERLAVLPESRRRRFGEALVGRVFAEATSWGTNTISIGVIAKQAELKQWYRNLGFVEGETKDFPHLPFSVAFMMCDLQ